MTCPSCGRDDCRVGYWRARAESPLDKMPREEIERALASARVCCFIRSRKERRPVNPR